MKSRSTADAGAERSGVSLRLEPSLAGWLVAVATRVGRSRNQVIELWLEALRAAVEVSGAVAADGRADVVLNCVERELVARLVELGVGGDIVLQALEIRREQESAEAEDVRSSRRRK